MHTPSKTCETVAHRHGPVYFHLRTRRLSGQREGLAVGLVACALDHEIKRDTETGRKITALYESGQLVPDEIVSVEIPASVELTVAKTEPGVQGDRVSGARKPATLETGVTVQVPLFVDEGDRVRVDTRTGDYITRV